MPTSSAAPPQVTRVGDLDGLADMVADLLSDNLRGAPGRAALLSQRTWVASVVVPDAESHFAIRLSTDDVSVLAEPQGNPSLRITIDGETLVELPEIPLLVGLPDPRTPPGRALIAKLIRRQVTIRGLFRHPVRLTRLLRLLNTAGATTAEEDT